MIGNIIWLAGTYPRYWKDVGMLSDSTYYSYQHESMEVYIHGEWTETEYEEDERMFVSYQSGDYSYMYTIGVKDVDTVERHLRR